MTGIRNSLGRILTAVGSELTEPTVKRSLGITPALASAIISGLSLALAFCTFLYVYAQNNERDRKSASLRICEAYVTNPLLDRALEEVRSRNRTLDASRGEVVAMDTIKSNFPDPFVRDVVEYNFVKWLNFLDVVALGLDEGSYDEDLIKSCIGPIFVSAAPGVLKNHDDKQAILKMDDFERVTYWSCRFRSVDQRRRQQFCHAILDVSE